MNKRDIRTGLLPIVFIASAAQGQTSLQPLWVHTWPFGQGEVMFIMPPARDNHVCVDRTSGIVYVSIDDQDQMLSPRWDLLYSFASDGMEVTPDPVPLLGAMPSQYPDLNSEGTLDLGVYAGIALQRRHYFTMDLGVSHLSIALRFPDGRLWHASTGAALSPPLTAPYIDEEGVIMCGMNPGTAGWLSAIDTAGWPAWARSFDGNGYIFNAVVVDGVIYAGSSGKVLVVDRATGDLLDEITLSSNGHVSLATDGIDLYYQWSYMAETHFGKVTVDGVPLWDRQQNEFLMPGKLKVDDLGRLWSLAADYSDTGPTTHLVVTTADGSAYEEFTYAATINDMDVAGDQAYLTGWTDTTTTGTYLIAVSTDMNVGQPETSPTSMRLSPVPVSDVLGIACVVDILLMEVLDASGRTVLRPAPTARTLNVAALAPGSYSLRACTKRGPVQQRFSVAR